MINIVNTFNQKLKIVSAHNTECYKLMKIKVENFGVVNDGNVGALGIDGFIEFCILRYIDDGFIF